MDSKQFYNYIIENFNLGGTSARLVENIIEYVKQQDFVDAEDAQRHLYCLLGGAFGIEEHEVKNYRCDESVPKENADLLYELTSGNVSVLEVFEELDYRNNAPDGRWHDILGDYETSDLEYIEKRAIDFVDEEAVSRVLKAVNELEAEQKCKFRRTAEDIRKCFVDSYFVTLYISEKENLAQRNEEMDSFEDFLNDIIEQNIIVDAKKVEIL